MVDLRKIASVSARRDAHGQWLSRHLKCKGNVDTRFTPPKHYGHCWRDHWWSERLRVWIWGPCEHCGRYRITDVYGNCIILSPTLMIEDYLIVNDNFDNFIAIAKEAIRKEILEVRK